MKNFELKELLSLILLATISPYLLFLGKIDFVKNTLPAFLSILILRKQENIPPQASLFLIASSYMLSVSLEASLFLLELSIVSSLTWREFKEKVFALVPLSLLLIDLFGGMAITNLQQLKLFSSYSLLFYFSLRGVFLLIENLNDKFFWPSMFMFLSITSTWVTMNLKPFVVAYALVVILIIFLFGLLGRRVSLNLKFFLSFVPLFLVYPGSLEVIGVFLSSQIIVGILQKEEEVSLHLLVPSWVLMCFYFLNLTSSSDEGWVLITLGLIIFPWAMTRIAIYNENKKEKIVDFILLLTSVVIVALN